MLVVDQPMIFVASSPVPLVAHPKTFIEIGILTLYSPISAFVFWVSYIHCLLTDSNNMYAIGVICILSSDAVSVAHRFKFDSDFIFINTYHVRNTTAMIRTFQCRSCVISICKADWPHYDRVSSFSPLSTCR